jgi:hypothetical protein
MDPALRGRAVRPDRLPHGWGLHQPGCRDLVRSCRPLRGRLGRRQRGQILRPLPLRPSRSKLLHRPRPSLHPSWPDHVCAPAIPHRSDSATYRGRSASAGELHSPLPRCIGIAAQAGSASTTHMCHIRCRGPLTSLLRRRTATTNGPGEVSWARRESEPGRLLPGADHRGRGRGRRPSCVRGRPEGRVPRLPLHHRTCTWKSGSHRES